LGKRSGIISLLIALVSLPVIFVEHFGPVGVREGQNERRGKISKEKLEGKHARILYLFFSSKISPNKRNKYSERIGLYVGSQIKTHEMNGGPTARLLDRIAQRTFSAQSEVSIYTAVLYWRSKGSSVSLQLFFADFSPAA